MKIHKAGKQTVSKYIPFGSYRQVPTPLCVGAKALYDGKSFQVHRLWKYVTCKHCLKKRKKEIGLSQKTINDICSRYGV